MFKKYFIQKKQKAWKQKEKAIDIRAKELWEENGQLEGTKDYYRQKAKKELDNSKCKKIVSFFTQPFIFTEKKVIEPFNTLLNEADIFNILEKVGVLLAVLLFILDFPQRSENNIFQAWQIVNEARDKEVKSGVVKIALERLYKSGFSLAGIDAQGDNLELISLTPPSLWQINFWLCLLNGVYLKEANLQEADLQKANLEKANLSEVNLKGADLQEADLYHVNLQKANLRFANLQDAKLQNAKLQEADLYYAILHKADLERANLLEVKLEGADLQEAKLQETNLQRSNLKFSNLQKANLFDANLQKANLHSANLQEVDLYYANLENANLDGGNLQEATLHSANLQEANLKFANLQKTNLKVTNLQKANLEFANLQEADLQKANLEFANLQNANLEFANLQEADKLTNRQIKSACNWEKAYFAVTGWDKEKRKWILDEQKQKAKIKELKEDKASNPKEKPNCDKWK